jgi:hypothetical protein
MTYESIRIENAPDVQKVIEEKRLPAALHSAIGQRGFQLFELRSSGADCLR